MKIDVKAVGDNAALVLDEEARALLGVNIGDSLALEFDDQGATLTAPDSDHQIRLERGRGFVQRYIKSFEALAK
jgi:hypothetical protein